MKKINGMVSIASMISTLLVTFTALFSVSVIAASPAAKDDVLALQKLLQPLDNLQGQFVQQQFDSDGELLQKSEGRFALQRPGKFSWHTFTPFEQELISDGKTLWLYDPDLEQVAIKKIDANLQQTPALILSGNTEALSKDFQVSEVMVNPAAKTREFLLTPNSKGGVFESLVLVFKDSVLSLLKVHDTLGQVTEFKLLDVSVNAKIKAEQFEFHIPNGTEVIADE